MNAVSSAFTGILSKLAQSTDWPDCLCGFPVVLQLFVQARIASNLAGLGLSLTHSLPLLLLHLLLFCSAWENSVCCDHLGCLQYVGFFLAMSRDDTSQTALDSWRKALLWEQLCRLRSDSSSFTFCTESGFGSIPWCRPWSFCAHPILTDLFLCLIFCVTPFQMQLKE